MSSGYDLSLKPDSRFLKFRESFTTREHMMELYDAARAHTAIDAAGHAATVQRLERLGGELRDMNWAVEDGFNLMAEEISGLRDDVREGFRGMRETFTWGIARLCWEHEQSREVYRRQLDVMKHPLRNQALELRERAENAIRNKWWEDAANDLQAAIDNNRYDYLAHAQLGEVMWFQFGQWEAAMEQFELAAKYADAVDATEQQRYYAAVAYSHVSLLWRMDAQTHPDRAKVSYGRADRAARRAAELAPDLLVALQESVLALLGLKRRDEAWAVMERAVSRDETMLLGLEDNPETAGWPAVRAFAKHWRETLAPLVEEARSIQLSLDELPSEAKQARTCGQGGRAAGVPLVPVAVAAAPIVLEPVVLGGRAAPGPRRPDGPLGADLLQRGALPRAALALALEPLPARLGAARRELEDAAGCAGRATEDVRGGVLRAQREAAAAAGAAHWARALGTVMVTWGVGALVAGVAGGVVLGVLIAYLPQWFAVGPAMVTGGVVWGGRWWGPSLWGWCWCGWRPANWRGAARRLRRRRRG